MPKMPAWLSVEDALNKILGLVPVLDIEERPLLEALGQVLAEEIRATFPVPPRANSSMDGYAVRSADIAGAGSSQEVTLRVVGQLAAGAVPETSVGSGLAVRIMTGALIPEGADAVVPFEETDELERAQRGEAAGDSVGIRLALPAGANVRSAGEDIREGDRILAAGTVLRPAEIGVMASMGHATARVIKRPVVAILSTGDELVEPPNPLPPGKIYNSNTYSVAASVQRYGGIPKILGIARDTKESLKEEVRKGLGADMLITTAGVSRGDYDVVKDVLMEEGEIAFWTVRMRPAKPLAFGTLRAVGPGKTIRHVPHLGLPGNPVSTMVAFEEFARPAILKMQGRTDLAKPTIQAVLEDEIVNTDGRRVYARAIVTKRDGTYYARLTGNQGSGVLTSMTKANGLAICPEDTPVLKPGETVEVQMLDWIEQQG